MIFFFIVVYINLSNFICNVFQRYFVLWPHVFFMQDGTRLMESLVPSYVSITGLPMAACLL